MPIEKLKYVVFLATLTIGISACGKSNNTGSSASTSSDKSAHASVDPREKFKSMFAKADLVQLGEKVYQTKGMQTCLQCHRGAGQGEGYAGAAKLQAPNTFRSFIALGGYEALKANPEEFRNKMEVALLYLIHGGGLNWNNNFKKDHPEIVYDWSKTGKEKYDIMMWGVAQAEMKTKVKALHEELEKAGKNISDEDMSWLAAYSALQYIKTFEKPGKTSDGKPAPKIWE